MFFLVLPYFFIWCIVKLLKISLFRSYRSDTGALVLFYFMPFITCVFFFFFRELIAENDWLKKEIGELKRENEELKEENCKLRSPQSSCELYEAHLLFNSLK